MDLKSYARVFGLTAVVFASQVLLLSCRSVPRNCTAPATQILPAQLTVKLTDGTSVIGTTTLPGFPLQSEALGMMTIPLNQVRLLKFSPNHESASVVLANGDKLQGSLGAVTLKLRTLVGEVKIPLEKTVEICVDAFLAGTVSEGLVAYFPFEEDAADHSGHWNAGKVVGAEFQRDEATGKKALQFTGTGASYVVVPRTAALEPTDGITISMWVKGRPGQPAGHGWGTVLRKPIAASRVTTFAVAAVPVSNCTAPIPVRATSLVCPLPLLMSSNGNISSALIRELRAWPGHIKMANSSTSKASPSPSCIPATCTSAAPLWPVTMADSADSSPRFASTTVVFHRRKCGSCPNAVRPRTSN